MAVRHPRIGIDHVTVVPAPAPPTPGAVAEDEGDEQDDEASVTDARDRDG